MELKDNFPPSKKPKYVLSLTKEQELENQFTYHPPKDDQSERYVAIREKAKEFCRLILENTPASPHQTLAIRKLEECVMRANQAIACNE